MPAYGKHGKPTSGFPQFPPSLNIRNTGGMLTTGMVRLLLSTVAAGRTEIYARMSRFLKLPEGELSKLADLQRRERLKKMLGGQLKPLASVVS
jgi:hypothetical protein